MPLYRNPATYEGRVLEAWKRQRVPIVLAQDTTYPTVAAAYPALANYIAVHYRHVAEMPSRDGMIVVYAERDRDVTHTDADLGWDCFVDR